MNLSNLGFMGCTQSLSFKHDPIIVSRCGYTGEDGFEVSINNNMVKSFWQSLLEVKGDSDETLVAPVGLGARDTLRLEAGLCLYGQEMKEDISPVKAMLGWTISKKRKLSCDFLGGDVVKEQLENGVNRKRCGFIGDKIPIREGTELFTKQEDGSAGELVGEVSSGSVTPSVGKAIGMAYVNTPHNKFKTQLVAKVRNKSLPVTIKKMPFVPANYYKGPEQ